MFKIRQDQISRGGKPSEFQYYYAEASTLGLPPGEWPDTIQLEFLIGSTTILTRGQPIRDESGEDFFGYVYYHDKGLSLKIYND